MTIETEYNIGDMVWFMNMNVTREVKILKIVAVRTLDTENILYYYGYGENDKVHASKAYLTKQELLASL